MDTPDYFEMLEKVTDEHKAIQKALTKSHLNLILIYLSNKSYKEAQQYIERLIDE